MPHRCKIRNLIHLPKMHKLHIKVNYKTSSYFNKYYRITKTEHQTICLIKLGKYKSNNQNNRIFQVSQLYKQIKKKGALNNFKFFMFTNLHKPAIS